MDFRKAFFCALSEFMAAIAFVLMMVRFKVRPARKPSDMDDHRNTSGAVPHGRDPHRSRAPEFYGFVAWTSTYLAFILYLLWALIPDEYIVRAGIEWYPSRYDFFLYPLTNTTKTVPKPKGVGLASARLVSCCYHDNLHHVFLHGYCCDAFIFRLRCDNW